MMEQFLVHQRKVQSSFQKWELDRQRQHEMTMERWRQEARAHEKEMFGMFVKVRGVHDCEIGPHPSHVANRDTCFR